MKDVLVFRTFIDGRLVRNAAVQPDTTREVDGTPISAYATCPFTFSPLQLTEGTSILVHRLFYNLIDYDTPEQQSEAVP